LNCILQAVIAEETQRGQEQFTGHVAATVARVGPQISKELKDAQVRIAQLDHANSQLQARVETLEGELREEQASKMIFYSRQSKINF
jgi:hypothetical protein